MDSFLLLFLSTERPHSPSSIPCHDHQPNTQESTSSVLCPSCQPSMLSPDWLLEAFQVQPSIQCLSSPLAFCRLHWASTLTLSLSTPRPRALSHVTVWLSCSWTWTWTPSVSYHCRIQTPQLTHRDLKGLAAAEFPSHGLWMVSLGVSFPHHSLPQNTYYRAVVNVSEPLFWSRLFHNFGLLYLPVIYPFPSSFPSHPPKLAQLSRLSQSATSSLKSFPQFTLMQSWAFSSLCCLLCLVDLKTFFLSFVMLLSLIK